MTLAPYAAEIIERLESAGYEACAVGGCVRDSLMGLPVKDYDIATAASPEQVRALFDRTADTGAQFGTVTVIMPGGTCEVTTFRAEAGYDDYRRPASLRFGVSLEEDLARRDFTINAMAWHPVRGLTDLFGGRGDLEARLIRTVGRADERFCEDALRMLRAYRFAARLGFSLHEDTRAAIVRHAHLMRHVSAERVRDELWRILQSDRPQVLAKCLANGLLTRYFPLVGIGLDELASLTRGPAQRLAFMLYRVFEGDLVCACEAAGRLHFDNATLLEVKNLFVLLQAGVLYNRADIKYLLRDFGYENLLSCVEMLPLLGSFDGERFIRVLDDIIASGECYRLDMLKVTGRDLVSLGFKEGPEVGRMLRYLLDLVITEPRHNNRKELLSVAARCLRDL